MKRALGLLLVSAMVLGLGGCASSGVNNAATFAVTRSATLASGPAQRDLDTRGATVMQSADSPRVYDDVRGGIPTPEPAVPPHETHLAGPTPQIPIPMGGRMGLWAN